MTALRVGGIFALCCILLVGSYLLANMRHGMADDVSVSWTIQQGQQSGADMGQSVFFFLTPARPLCGCLSPSPDWTKCVLGSPSRHPPRSKSSGIGKRKNAFSPMSVSPTAGICASKERERLERQRTQLQNQRRALAAASPSCPTTATGAFGTGAAVNRSLCAQPARRPRTRSLLLHPRGATGVRRSISCQSRHGAMPMRSRPSRLSTPCFPRQERAARILNHPGGLPCKHAHHRLTFCCFSSLVHVWVVSGCGDATSSAGEDPMHHHLVCVSRADAQTETCDGPERLALFNTWVKEAISLPHSTFSIWTVDPARHQYRHVFTACIPTHMASVCLESES